MPTLTPATLEALTGLEVDLSHRAAIFDELPDLHYAPVDKAREQGLFAEIEGVIAERRFRVEYVVPQTAYFEYYAGIAVRRQLMLHFLPDSESLVELGCGTGINLLLAADLFSNASLAGSDWTRATLDILAALGEAKGRAFVPVLYNMLDQSGREDLPISSDTDVLTVHALEQLGAKASGVMDFLLAKRPRRCLHIEPILDFYDAADPFDDIARRYHLARGYLQGLRPKLRTLAASGVIEILGERRVKLGNQFHEAYSYVAWRPA